MTKETILIVEDEEGIREMTKLYLEGKGYSVLAAENGQKALNVIQDVSPQLILLDIEMPDMNGFEVCQEIRKQLIVPIIFLSVRRSTMDKVKCFELGGDDYMTKPYVFDELLARIQANIRRYQYSPESDDRINCGSLEIDLNHYKCYINGKPVHLYIKEMELLVHLVKHPNRVWSHEQLYDQIWNLDATGNIETVKVHISNLRRKIEEDPMNPKYIKTVRGFGYMFEMK
ncbi:response regulator transcription factor [Aquisalibacillus elongatus]|uniref:DNA-binding response OmpR family regulator n=1 Tax=Aquisalibacillus elongatus TaxID=485577 RepID=A0A3N5B4I4_9BACI|nr:response regulator transcription factor [Aquisalibacillus elongatus]RPF52223.1 DNA-binding response OmpR family regulator [Aquisalibacillus elongatus]